MSNRYRSSKGKADRKAHIRTEHSFGAMLERHIVFFEKNNALLHTLGGPVLHLTPQEYQAQKIAEAIARIRAGVEKRNAPRN